MRRLVHVPIFLFLTLISAQIVRADGWGIANLMGGGQDPMRDALPADDLLPPGSYVDLDAYMRGEPAVGPMAESSNYTYQFLPSGQIYKTYLAGTKEPRFSTLWQNEKDDGWFWENTLGARFGIFRYGTEDPYFPQGWQLDAEGAAMVRLDPEENMDVRSVDFRAGLPLAYGFGRYQVKFGYYHLSSHLGDEFLLKNPGYPRLNFARDCLILGGSVYVTERLRMYAETAWAFYSDVSQPWEFQFGMEYAPIGPTGILGEPFAAINGQLRQELDYSGALTVQAGWAWRSDATAHLLRIGGHYYNGLSNQYSFYNLFEQQLGLGIWYDY